MGLTTLALAGRYRLEERIAAGAVAEVWRGRDLVLARAVAVKLLRPDYVQHPETLARSAPRPATPRRRRPGQRQRRAGD